MLKKMADVSKKDAATYALVSRFFQGQAAAPEVAMHEQEVTAFREFRHAFENGRKLVKKLGEMANAEIEGDPATALIEESEKNGAFACKLPGAGGGDSIGALCLSKESKKKLAAFWQEKGVQLLEVNISDAGARTQTLQDWQQVTQADGEA